MEMLVAVVTGMLEDAVFLLDEDATPVQRLLLIIFLYRLIY